LGRKSEWSDEALKEGGNKWNPSEKRDRRGTTLEANIFVASRAARGPIDHP